jgi:hypothetical protein
MALRQAHREVQPLIATGEGIDEYQQILERHRRLRPGAGAIRSGPTRW